MKNKNYVLTTVFFLLLCTSSLFSEEIKYNFSKGAVYSYNYSRQDSSSVNAPIIGKKSSSNSQSLDFIIKTVGFLDNAFILDVGSEGATYRRYISPNGDLIGSPAEDRDVFPFFFVFPDGDWKIGKSFSKTSEVSTFGKKIPVVWNFTLKDIDSVRNIAEIEFEAKFKVANEDKLYSKAMSLNGKIFFNLAEGVIHQATWKSSYGAKQICKEMTITRSLWSFEKQSVHSLKLTGVDR